MVPAVLYIADDIDAVTRVKRRDDCAVRLCAKEAVAHDRRLPCRLAACCRRESRLLLGCLLCRCLRR